MIVGVGGEVGWTLGTSSLQQEGVEREDSPMGYGVTREGPWEVEVARCGHQGDGRAEVSGRHPAGAVLRPDPTCS